VTEDYSDYSKAELQAKADELGVEYDDSDTKSDLVAKINEAEDEESTDDGDEEGADEEETTEEEAYDSSPGAVASEQFPERRPIEPDLADVEAAEYDGEHLAPLNGESWVVLDGDHEEVPDELDGKIAAVVEFPTTVEQDPDTGIVSTYLPPQASLTVKERGQGTILYLPLDAFKEIHTHGRPATFA
jgi:hypothetical protein